MSDAKAAALKKFQVFQDSAPEAIKELEMKKTGIEERFKEFCDAIIIAEDTIYPGVAAHFGIVYRQVTEAEERCKLTIEGNQVLFSEYIPGK